MRGIPYQKYRGILVIAEQRDLVILAWMYISASPTEQRCRAEEASWHSCTLLDSPFEDTYSVVHKNLLLYI